MNLSPAARKYVHKLGALHLRAAKGDREALALCANIARRAAAGDTLAQRARNTIAAIHWKRRNGELYVYAESLYACLLRDEPAAQAELASLLQRLRSGDASAKPLFSTLKAIHRKHKASAWSGPGQPRIGHYPMPSHHRPGIVIGATSAYPVLDSLALSRLLALIAQATASIPFDFTATPAREAAAAAPSGPVNPARDNLKAILAQQNQAPVKAIGRPSPAVTKQSAIQSSLLVSKQPNFASILKK